MKKKIPLIITMLVVFIAVCIAAAIFGVKYFQTQKALTIANQELGEFKVSSLPIIEKNTSIKTVDQYFDYVMQDSFCKNYKLKLSPDAKLRFRDYEVPSEPVAENYGTTFPIAYIYEDNSGNHVVCFAVQYTESPAIPTVRYMLVTIEDLSAKLPNPAKASFVKAS